MCNLIYRSSTAVLRQFISSFSADVAAVSMLLHSFPFSFFVLWLFDSVDDRFLIYLQFRCALRYLFGFIALATVSISLDTSASRRIMAWQFIFNGKNTSSLFGKMSGVNPNIMRALFFLHSVERQRKYKCALCLELVLLSKHTEKSVHRPKLIHFWGP